MTRMYISGAAALMMLAGCDGQDAASISPADDPSTAARQGVVDQAVERGAAPGTEPTAAENEMTGNDANDESAPSNETDEGGQASLHGDLRDYVEAAVDDFDTIPEDRKRALRKLALFVRTKRSAGESADLIFICTHNSRRSHMGQLWASTAAAWYGVDGVGTYSGGTEATAFNPRAIAALERAGFDIDKPDGDAANPHYRVTYGPDGPVMEAFSKVYSDDTNPQKGFAAVMTCSEADKNCPVVEGAAMRVAVPYVDPKEADDTPEEAARYDERARQIATEVFYLFSQV